MSYQLTGAEVGMTGDRGQDSPDGQQAEKRSKSVDWHFIISLWKMEEIDTNDLNVNRIVLIFWKKM